MRLSTVRKFALRLPGVAEQPHFQYTSFRVLGKIFATAPREGVHLHIFISAEDRKQALLMHSDFVEELLWGGKVIGVRVELSRASLKVVKELIRLAWTAKASKSLITGIEAAES